MQPFTEISEQLERAARNGTKVHLTNDLVRALIESDAYSIITAERTKELVATWQDQHEKAATPTPAASSSARSGSGIAPIAMTGASAGMMTEQDQEAVGRAASRRALEAVQQTVGRRRQPKTR